MAQPMRMGRSSFTAMGRLLVASDHLTWNHIDPWHAPHPQYPDASEATWRTGGYCGVGRNEVPFQSSMKLCHQAKSALKSRLRRIGVVAVGRVSRAVLVCSRSIMRRKNERPERTTLHTWLSRPTSDSNSLLVQTLWSPHWFNSALTLCSFSLGSRSLPAMVSTSIPRNVRATARPSVLWTAIGIPRVAGTRRRVARLFRHRVDPGGAMMIKSSR
jgi:hypothetical protein